MTCANKIRIGDLRERILIEVEQEAEDGGGGHSKSWVEQATISAKATPLRGTEEERGGQKGVRVVLFTIRRRGDIKHDMRIFWNGLYHNINDVRDPGPRGSFMEIVGKSGVTI